MRISRKGAVIAAIAVVLLIGAIVLAYGIKRLSNYKTLVQEIQFTSIDLPSVPDGIYTGDCNVDLIYAEVRVTIANGAIVSIELLRHDNGRGAPAEQIIDDMLVMQTTDVDAVSGATNSSMVIRKAVENALLNRR